MYRTFHLQHQQPAQKAMGALGITLRILKNLKPDPFCLFFAFSHLRSVVLEVRTLTMLRTHEIILSKAHKFYAYRNEWLHCNSQRF